MARGPPTFVVENEPIVARFLEALLDVTVGQRRDKGDRIAAPDLTWRIARQVDFFPIAPDAYERLRPEVDRGDRSA